MSAPLARVTSIKVKLGVLVAASVLVAAVLGTVSNLGGVPPWLAIPVTVALALAVTQLLATGMTSPLRQMTAASRRMARGDYAGRVSTTSTDEVGELASAFNTMAADLAAVDQQRRDLVATVSHELRTPLTGLVAVLENIEDGVADPAAVGTALRQARRLGDLVRDLLDLSRLDAGAVPLERQQVVVAALVADAVAEARTLDRDVDYDTDVDDRLVVDGDPARLHQLLANLLDNASRHAPAGATVRVRVTANDDRWRLAVANPGSTITPDDGERAFERFGRLDATGGGTGLGLAIARWVAGLHGGTVTFAEPGEPDQVVVAADLPRLPTVPTPAPGAAMPATVTPPPAAPPAPEAPAPPPPADFAPTLWPLGQPPARPRLLVAAVVVGLLAAVLLVDHDPGIGWSVVLLAGAFAVWTVMGRRRDWFTLLAGGLGCALVLVLTLRDAVWIGVLCLLAATALGLVVCTRGRGLLGLVLSGVLWPLTALHGLPWLGRTLRALSGRGQGLAVVRTALLSAAALVAFGLLFASADALFAHWFSVVLPSLDDVLLGRIFVGLFVGGLTLCTGYYALNPPAVDALAGTPRPVGRRYEWLVPVLLVDAVFVVFLLAQATATFGGHDYVRRTTGLTYADYVHQGFGQLTVAAALTLLVVTVAFRKAPRATASDRAWLRGSLGVLCLATLVVLASALHRMDLYQQAYGFTRLRLLVDAFEIWLGLLVVGLIVAGVRLRGSWLPRIGLLSGAAVLLALALANPDAVVARQNVDRYHETGQIDLDYLSGLSADATGVVLQLPRTYAECALTSAGRSHDDPTEWNLGRSIARHALAGRDLVRPASCPGSVR